MKKLKIIGVLLVFAISVSAQKATDTKTNVIKPKRELVVDVNLTNPLLFGKAGAGVEWRSPKNSLYVYGNYRFGVSAIPQTVYFKQGESAVAEAGGGSNINVSGFDLGFQIRFRDKVIAKEYAGYLDDLEEKSPFYSGFWIETSYAKSDAVIVNNNSYTNTSAARLSKVWDMKLGPIIGWNIKVSNFNVDIYGALGLGFSSIKYSTLFLKNQSTTVGIFKYDFGVKLGYKIR